MSRYRKEITQVPLAALAVLQHPLDAVAGQRPITGDAELAVLLHQPCSRFWWRGYPVRHFGAFSAPVWRTALWSRLTRFISPISLATSDGMG